MNRSHIHARQALYQLSYIPRSLSFIALDFFFFFFCFFFDRVYLCRYGGHGTQNVYKAGEERRNPPVSASQVLGLKACATTPSALDFLTMMSCKILIKPSLAALVPSLRGSF